MSNLWNEPAYIKIHEGCGGRIRWVEAIDTPGVGYTGECTECLKENVVTEDIIPIEVRGDAGEFAGEFDIRDTVLEMKKDELAELTWKPDDTYDENQERIRSEVGVDV